MKKRYIVAGIALGLTLIGGIGSALTMTTALPKLDRYIVERRASILNNKEIFSSGEKVNQLNLGNLGFYYNTAVNIRKSRDNNIRVTATCINDKNYYDVNIKDGRLNINIDENKKLDSNSAFDNGVYLGDDKKVHFLGKSYSIFAVPKELIAEQIDKMAISGLRIRSDFNSGVRSEDSKLFKLNIEIPENVDIVFNPSMHPGGIVAMDINIEDGMIKDYISLNSIYLADSIKYKGNIKNLKINVNESENKISLNNLAGNINVNKMEINANPGTYFVGDMDGKKLAQELIINFQGEKKALNEDEDMYDLYYSEEKILEHIIDKIKYPDSDDREDSSDSSIEARIDKLEKKSNKVAQEKRLIELFSNEIEKKKELEKNNQEEVGNLREFNNSCDASINVYRNMADKLVINANNSNIKVELDNDLNPNLDLKTKDGIDFRYYFIDKISAEKIPNKNSTKDYKGTVLEYIKKSNPSYNSDITTSKPSIVVNSKTLRLVEKDDEED